MPRPRGPRDGPDGNPVPRRRKPIREKGGRIMSPDPSRDKEMRAFFSAVNHDAFREACEGSSDPRFNALVECLVAPRFRNWSIHRLARTMNITLQELFEFWRDNRHLTGMIQMMDAVPDIYRTVGEDAISRNYPCDACEGAGKRPRSAEDPTIVQCSSCHGTGVMRVMGNDKARELVFETTGLTGRKGGMNVIGQVNINEGETLESMIASAQKVLASRPRMIELPQPEKTP